MRTLADYLNVADDEEEDLAQKMQARVQGSCEWLLEEDDFIKWRERETDPRNKNRQIYLLTGDPGSC